MMRRACPRKEQGPRTMRARCEEKLEGLFHFQPISRRPSCSRNVVKYGFCYVLNFQYDDFSIIFVSHLLIQFPPHPILARSDNFSSPIHPRQIIKATHIPTRSFPAEMKNLHWYSCLVIYRDNSVKRVCLWVDMEDTNFGE